MACIRLQPHGPTLVAGVFASVSFTNILRTTYFLLGQRLAIHVTIFVYQVEHEIAALVSNSNLSSNPISPYNSLGLSFIGTQVRDS